MRRAWLLTLGLLVCSGWGGAASLPPLGELRYTVCFGDLRPVGTVTYDIDPEDGETVLTLALSDRGRGQNLTARFRFDAAGFPVWERLAGVDYLKSPVDERFELAQGKASWDSGAEKGERKVAGPAFYVLREGADLDLGALARALLASPQRRVALLPEGEARIERVDSERVEAGGRAQEITLYAVSGITSAPLYVWMEADGRFFGRYDGFVTVVPKGWEKAAPAMIKLQAQATAARQKALAAKLSHHPAGPVVLKGARLFDAETAKIQPGMTVVLSGNRIQAVGPDGKVPAPKGAEVIDARGQTLLPGLWDMHQHFTEGDGLLDLAAGVTTGRDMANDPDYLLGLKKRWETGEALGPRVVLAGVIEGPGPYAAPTSMLADTAEKARALVDQYLRWGYAQIKIYSSLDPKLVPPIVAEAHGHGLRVSGHIPNGMTAEQAVREGFDEIQHANFLFLNFIPGVDTRTMDRFTAVAEHAAELDLKSEPVQAFFRLLKEKKTVIDPTVNTYEDMFTGRPDRIRPTMAPVADRIPYQARRALLGGNNLPAPPGLEQRYRDSYRATLALVKALYDQGIPIVAGTDSIAGATLHRELELYVEAGIPAPEVLRIATLGGARVMKLDHDLGTIAPGKLADLILVKGDPTKNISDIRRTTLVVKDGVMFRPAELYEAIGVKPAA